MKTSLAADSNRNGGLPAAAGAGAHHRVWRSSLWLFLLGALLSSPVGGRVVAQESPSKLSAALTPEGVELIWALPGIVESAAQPSGPWTPLTQVSPQRVHLTEDRQFFRLAPSEGSLPPVTPDYGYDPSAIEGVLVDLPSNLPAPPTAATVTRRFLPPVGRQGTAAQPGSPGSCAAWASTYGLASFTAAQRGNYSPTNATQWASPAAIYIQVLALDGLASNACHGSQMTTYYRLLHQGGTPSLDAAPYFPSCSNLWSLYGGGQPPADSTFTLPPVRAVSTTNLTAIKQILASDRVLTYGTRLYTDWSRYRGEVVPYKGNGVVAFQPDGQPVGHCLLIIGYDDKRQAMLIQNSEGSDWGGTMDGEPPNADRTNAGYVWIAYNTFVTLAQGTAFHMP